jgi:hypothetical protein
MRCELPHIADGSAPLHSAPPVRLSGVKHVGKPLMIHLVSMSAHDPAHVADVLAELMGGRCYPFPGAIPDSFMAVSGDAQLPVLDRHFAPRLSA